MGIKEYFKKFYGMTPYLRIEEDEWQYILKTYEKDDIVETLSEVCHTYPLPIPVYTNEEVLEDYKKLKGTWWPDILIEGEWFPRNSRESEYPLTMDGKHLYFKKYTVGNKCSNKFHVENRYKVDWVRGPSGWRTWQTVEGIKTIVRAFFTLEKVLTDVNINSLKMAMNLRKYVASQFKPNVAKALYDYFNSENVLDFSAGWGDRFAGFYASPKTKHYVGIDPNLNNHPNYLLQEEYYKKYQTFFEEPKKATFIPQPAEDVDYSEYENYFDTVFTSPPYFNTERYSDHDTQSYLRYKEIDDWNTNFLHKALDKIIPTIKKDGILAVNIADVYSAPAGGYVDITNSMNNFLVSRGLKYRGCIGMEMTKRPNNGGAGTGVSEYFSDESKKTAEQNKNHTFGEPIWIFQK
jgi:hypothetical protein